MTEIPKNEDTSPKNVTKEFKELEEKQKAKGELRQQEQFIAQVEQIFNIPEPQFEELKNEALKDNLTPFGEVRLASALVFRGLKDSSVTPDQAFDYASSLKEHPCVETKPLRKSPEGINLLSGWHTATKRTRDVEHQKNMFNATETNFEQLNALIKKSAVKKFMTLGQSGLSFLPEERLYKKTVERDAPQLTHVERIWKAYEEIRQSYIAKNSPDLRNELTLAESNMILGTFLKEYARYLMLNSHSLEEN